MNESSYCEMGRILYKLANVLCVNSHEEYGGSGLLSLSMQ